MARILAVDDERAILDALARVLGRDGHEVVKAADPTAVPGMDLSRFDLVLCDVMMPGLDGFELVRQIRPDFDGPIVFLTARVAEEDAVAGYGLGADDYVRKPFGAAELRAKVAAHLGLATLMWTVPGGAQETGGPYMRDPRHPRHFTDDFKRQIVDLYNAGKPKREIMDEYDLGKSTVERWIKSINATGSPRAADNRTPEQNRILELERENRRLRMEVDVLKQAALIYARK